jgi:hypothetical protein
METKHTPGPWKLMGDLRIVGAEVPAKGDMSGFYPGIIRLDRNSNGTYVSMTFEEREANAKLIAAAPELLEACLNFMKHAQDKNITPTDVYFNSVDLIKAAIQKALGNNQ